jgi:nucleoredoxin
MEKFGSGFVNKEGTQFDQSVFKDLKYVCVYFGAQYVEPCERFLPSLMDFYEKVNNDEKCLEILYCGLDAK